VFDNLRPAVLYDVLHDDEYRREWDENMAAGYQVCTVNPCNDIWYYAIKLVPLRARDFVMQRSWLVQPNDEYVIMYHSISHAHEPPRNKVIRAVTMTTGCYLRPVWKAEKTGPPTSTDFIYITQCDPRGQIPIWLVNKVYRFTLPQVRCYALR
jgi:hypothetical protein